MAGSVECYSQHLILHKRQNIRSGTELKCSFGQNSFAGEKWLMNLLRNANSPFVMLVMSIPKSNKKPSICNADHPFEKPLREDRSAGPTILPACRRNLCRPFFFLVFSSCSRTTR